jgi:hypothetical protein
MKWEALILDLNVAFAVTNQNLIWMFPQNRDIDEQKIL